MSQGILLFFNAVGVGFGWWIDPHTFAPGIDPTEIGGWADPYG